ncbi:MAG: phosphatidylglycerophosphatase A [Elusimicrobia bacterium]|nr:phosphatidylglycerophosphatase A [Elusimicrobiota bacterium]
MSAADRVTVALATGFHLSYIPVRLASRLTALRQSTGAGFVGSLEGLALWLLWPENPAGVALGLAIVSLGACFICDRAERVLGSHDDPRIVLDEVVGFWAAAAFLPRTLPHLAAAFVIFRIFDATKLPPIRWLERLPGGWGVVADDLGAGVCANLLVRLWLG